MSINNIMTAIRSKQESRVILDLSNQKFSKSNIKKTLRKVEVKESEISDDFSKITFIENSIVIGMYRIHLLFSSLSVGFERQRLRDYGKFKVAVFESNGEKEINLNIDNRFNKHSWIKKNKNYKLCIEDLVELIGLCHKMNGLKAFL